MLHTHTVPVLTASKCNYPLELHTPIPTLPASPPQLSRAGHSTGNRAGEDEGEGEGEGQKKSERDRGSSSTTHLELLLDRRVRQLVAVALHLGGAAVRAVQAAARRVLHLLQLALEPLKLGLALPTRRSYCTK